VNWETAKTPAPPSEAFSFPAQDAMSNTERFIFPSASWKILKWAIFSASHWASFSESPSATPRYTRSPLAIAPVMAPPTVTEAFLTR